MNNVTTDLLFRIGLDANYSVSGVHSGPDRIHHVPLVSNNELISVCYLVLGSIEKVNSFLTELDHIKNARQDLPGILRKTCQEMPSHQRNNPTNIQLKRPLSLCVEKRQ